MNISIDAYRARIGNFNCKTCRMIVVKYIKLPNMSLVVVAITLIALLLFSCGDIELNPGPSINNSSGDLFSESFLYDNDTSTFTEKFQQHLSFIHLNIQSLRPKIDIINANLREFDILCFTESWLDGNIPDDDISIENFTHYRNDRSSRMGMGLLFTVKTPYIVKEDLI